LVLGTREKKNKTQQKKKGGGGKGKKRILEIAKLKEVAQAQGSLGKNSSKI